MYTTEILKLDKMLTTARIPHHLHTFADGWQICYPNVEEATDAICDVICHSGSYGHEQDLLEIMGLVDTETVGDEVEGYLTAQDVFSRIFLHFSGDKAYEDMKTSKEILGDCEMTDEDIDNALTFMENFINLLCDTDEEIENDEED